ncbi:MAG: nucleotide pyrophosphohydrolase [Firmicutes bacterium]|nr:nucleotide pyrophosphohydrolase [Bacillota bacterium]
MELTIQQMQQDVDRYIGQFREGYFAPMTLVVRLTEELGELAREINHHFGEKPKRPDEPNGDIALELGDMMFVITCLANTLDIDLADAHQRVMEKFDTRDRTRWTRIDSTVPEPRSGDKQGSRPK